MIEYLIFKVTKSLNNKIKLQRMFQPKFCTMRTGATTVISSVNRLQLAIDASKSITTATYPCGYQHVTCLQPTTNESMSMHLHGARSYSTLNKNHAIVSIRYYEINRRIERNSVERRPTNKSILNDQMR